jgi:hypothetical protein
MSTEFSLTIDSAKVHKFYDSHPNLDITQMNEMFCDILENLVDNLDNTMNSSMRSEILSTLRDQNSKISDLKGELKSMEHSISNNLTLKFVDLKRDYIEDVKNIVHLSSSDNNEKLTAYLNKENENLLSKTEMIIKEIAGKDENSKVISQMLDSFKADLTTETKKLLETSVDSSSITNFISNFDTKCSSLFTSLNTPLYTCISATEERIQNNLSAIKNASTSNEKVFDELGQYLAKFNNSSLKGGVSERQLEDVVAKMYPTADIVDTSTQSGSGDLVLKRPNKVEILLENKLYGRNLGQSETDKFVRDANSLRMHGIFISQTSGIVSKDNFQIDIHNGLVLIYLHNVQYDADKIRSAIEIIDSLSSKLNVVDGEHDSNSISSEILESMNYEFQSFLSKKENIIASTKENQRKLISQLEELTLMSLEKYLSTKFSFTKKGFTCEICDNWTGPTKKSLSAHMRACKKTGAIKVDTI